MIKYHTTRFGVDKEVVLDALRKEFPGYFFFNGVYKDSKGIFCCYSQVLKDYGEKFQLENGDWFFGPSAKNIESLKFTDHETDPSERIDVKLVNGKTLRIYPATALPRQVLFGKRRKSDSTASPFNTDIAYGKAAYELYFRSSKNEQILLDDPQMIQFVEMALRESYKLPSEFWDSIRYITTTDIDKIFSAAMGMSWEYLQDEIKKSNGQLQQATGVTAS